MALIKCKDCGAQISDTAAFCPQCGYIPEPGPEMCPNAGPPNDCGLEIFQGLPQQNGGKDENGNFLTDKYCGCWGPRPGEDEETWRAWINEQFPQPPKEGCLAIALAFLGAILVFVSTVTFIVLFPE